MIRRFLLAGLLLAPALLRAQSWQWVTPAGGSGYARMYAVGTDAAGNTVVAGDFTGTITLGATTLTSAGNRDVFVGRLNSAGAWTQAVRAGGTGEDYVIDVALDANGTVTALGGFYSSVAQFGPLTLSKIGTGAGAEVFVARLSAAGTWTQATAGGAQGANYPAALAVDGAGNTVVGGYFYGQTTSFGPFTLTNNSAFGNTTDAFVARLSAAGTWTQAVQAGGSADDQIRGLAVDAAGTVTAVGSFNSPTLRAGGFTLTNADASGSTSDVFAGRLPATGSWLQALRAGGASGDFATDVVVDDAGAATVVGSFGSNSISFGTSQLTNANTNTTTDIFVASLPATSGWSQALRAGGLGIDNAYSAARSANGQLTISGLFYSPAVSFGSLQLTNASAAGTADLFVARLNGSGTAWSQALRAGGVNNDAALQLSLTPTGEATVAGIYQTATTVGTTTLTAPTTNDAFYVARTAGLLLRSQPLVAAGPPLVLAPNPARHATILQLPAAASARSLLLLDCLGRPLRQLAVPAHATAVPLDLAGLAPGLYLVQCGAAVGRLVVE